MRREVVITVRGYSTADSARARRQRVNDRRVGPTCSSNLNLLKPAQVKSSFSFGGPQERNIPGNHIDHPAAFDRHPRAPHLDRGGFADAVAHPLFVEQTSPASCR